MPYRMHEFYLREMYLNNNLIKPDALTIAGEPIDLTLIHTAALRGGRRRRPHRALAPDVPHQQLGHRPKRFVLSSSGHILGIVNPPVSPPKRHY